MAHKSKKNDNYLGYMDGVCVKISEKYKPPKKISLSQRSAINDSTMNQSFQYKFDLETTICTKLNELRAARKSMQEERKTRLSLARKARETSNSHKVNSHSEWLNVNSNSNENTPNKDINVNVENHSYHKLREVCNEAITSNTNNLHNILLPTPAYLPINQNPSSVLTPVQIGNRISNTNDYNHSKRSPFNISDFENDTSSPFDNMELKTLNDMEELAQVLQPDVEIKTNLANCNNSAVVMSNHLPYSENTSYTNHQMAYKDNSRYVNLPNTCEIPSFNSHHKDLVFNSQPITKDIIQSFNDILSVSYPNTVSLSDNTVSYSIQNQKSSSRSVPDIMEALKKELQTKTEHEHNRESVSIHDSSSIANKSISEQQGKDDLSNPFDTLNDKLQKIAIEVSQMGFPIGRVARACSVLGDDQEKIVEHVIALSELMDVGFSESQVAEVLIKFDNDRDKALDYLIK